MALIDPIWMLVLGACLASGSFLPPGGGQSYTTVNPSIINQAMVGVDPLALDLLGKPNSGLKDQIFIPGTYGNFEAFLLFDFMGRAVDELRCDALLSPAVQTLYNYNAYREALGESVSYSTSEDTAGGQGREATSCNVFASDPNENDNLVEFFRRGGEAVIVEARCQTHAVSVNINTKPFFTKSFNMALKKISSVVTDPTSERSREMFLDFVKDYGTHFQDTTYFGSRLLVVQLFAKKADTSTEKMYRQSCVSSLFFSSFREEHFGRVPSFIRQASLCDKSGLTSRLADVLELSTTRILALGAIPILDQEKPNQRQAPIHYRLRRISKLFDEEWIDTMRFPVNKTVMREYLDYMTSEYENAALGAPCKAVITVGCGYAGICSTREKCIDDPSVSDGFVCRKLCEISNICPENTACTYDSSLEGFSCKKECRFSGNCTDDTV